MAIASQSIIDRAEIILQDTTNVRWSESELIGWLNDGQREIVLLRPSANTINSAVQLVAGTKQSLPAGGLQLVKITRNMGTTGTDAGNMISSALQMDMDAVNPNWHSEAAKAIVKNYIYDERDPRVFYVYPQQPSSSRGYVEMVYSKPPVNVSTTGSVSSGSASLTVTSALEMAVGDDITVAGAGAAGANLETTISAIAGTVVTLGANASTTVSGASVWSRINLPDIYAGPLLDYVLYRSYSKEAEHIAETGRASAHMQAFLNSVSVGREKQVEMSPN